MSFKVNNHKEKSKIVKFFDYLTTVRRRKFLASFMGVKKSNIYALQSSISSDLFFIIEKNTSNFLAVSSYDSKPFLIGYNHLSKKVIDSKFTPFNGIAELIINEMLDYIKFLDISRYNLTLENISVNKYVIIIDNVEHFIQKNVCTYKNNLDNDVVEYYYQEFYTCIKNNTLMFTGIIPDFSLSLQKYNTDLNADTLGIIEQTNNDLDLIYAGMVTLIKGKGRNGDQLFFNHEDIIQSMKNHYLDTYYHGWKELGYPKTIQDVQLLKMIAI